MQSMVTIGHLLAQAENCEQFQQFSAEFDRLGVANWLTPRERALHFAMGAFHGENKVAVELGTFEGASALFTMAGMRHQGAGRLFAIDPHLGAPPFFGSAPYQFTLRKFRDHAERAGLAPYLKTIISDSQIASSVWPAQPIDSLLIDADHSYTGCLRDIECWGVKLRPGGLMLIDDADAGELPELLLLIEDIKAIKGLVFEDLIDGLAVFRRAETDSFALLDEIRSLSHLLSPRPWDMEFIQSLAPDPSYRSDAFDRSDYQVAYQLGFLARCEPGDYAVSHRAPPSDVAIVDALLRDKGNGAKQVVDPAKPITGRYRMAVCSVDEAVAFKDAMLPGGVVIARSALPVTQEHWVFERRRMVDAGFEGCDGINQIYWGIARPHMLSMEAIMAYIQKCMR